MSLPVIITTSKGTLINLNSTSFKFLQTRFHYKKTAGCSRNKTHFPVLRKQVLSSSEAHPLHKLKTSVYYGSIHVLRNFCRSSKKQPPFEQLLYTKTFDHKDMVYQELRGMQSFNLTTVQISSVLDKITLCKETSSINTAFRRELEFLSVGWMTCDFTFFSTVYQSYWEYRLMIMKGSVQWNPIYQAGLELGIECWNHFSQQIANNTNKLNLVKELFNTRLHVNLSTD